MELEQSEGTVEDISFEIPVNGYTVFEFSGGGTVTVVCGIVGELHAGESVVCRGKYENHATYGRQFHAQECETDMPKDLEAVYAFLASRSLPYIGARTADKIIDKFGAEALEVIANDPARLTLIPGISADKADRIQQEFKRMFGMRELIAYLAQFEISPRRAMEVFRTFGPGAMQAIQQNPYLLCGEPLQLDFRHADSIAQYYHMEGDCAQRLEAALLRTLRHNAGNGHTCLPRAQLLDTASHFIQQPPEKLARALDHCIETGQLGIKMLEAVPYIYLPDLLEAEQAIADRLALRFRGLHRAAYNRFYIDDVYQFVTHKVIFRFVSTPIAWFDRHVVDGFMNLQARAAGGAAYAIRDMQSGSVQRYCIWFLGGALGLTILILLIC